MKLTHKELKYNTELLFKAIFKGEINEMERLIPISNPRLDHSYALRISSRFGYIDIVKLLLPVSDPKADNSDALSWAALKGHTEIVEMLIPVSDPKAVDSYALRVAAEHGRTECVKLLIPVSNYQQVLQDLKEMDSVLILQQSIDAYEALLQKERFLHNLDSVATIKTNSGKRKL